VKICIHSCLKNDGMALFVVKILAAEFSGQWILMYFASILSMQFGKFQGILKFSTISLNISSAGKGICCTCRAVHKAQVL